MNKKLKHFKMSRFKPHRKPINKKALLIVLFVLVCIAASFALGKYLDHISSDTQDGTDSDGGTASPERPYDEYEKIEAERIAAAALEYSAYLSDEEADRAILKLNGSLRHAVSLRLLNAEGAPAYKSDVYERVYSADSGELDLSRFMEKAKQNGIYVCAVFDVSCYSDNFADVAEARRSFELALIKEAYDCGVRDMLLCGIEERDPDALYELAKSIKSTAPELILGFAADHAELCADSMLCAKLDDIFDYIAFDMTGALYTADGGDQPAPDTDDTAQDTDSTTDSTTDSATDAEDSEPALPETEPSALYEAIVASVTVMQRFASRAYVSISDLGTPDASRAEAEFAAAAVDSYIISAEHIEQVQA